MVRFISPTHVAHFYMTFNKKTEVIRNENEKHNLVLFLWHLRWVTTTRGKMMPRNKLPWDFFP